MKNEDQHHLNMSSSDDPEGPLRARLKLPAVRTAPFAGRIGGNQEFIAVADDQASEDIRKKQPDAVCESTSTAALKSVANITMKAPGFSLRESLDPRGFLVADTWRQAIIECWGKPPVLTHAAHPNGRSGTCLLIFMLGAAANGSILAGVSPFAATIYSAIASWIGLTLFIYAAAPVSGGHLKYVSLENFEPTIGVLIVHSPSITMATFTAGLSTMPRTVLYIVGQCVGAIIGGYWLRLGIGDKNFFPDVSCRFALNCVSIC